MTSKHRPAVQGLAYLVRDEFHLYVKNSISLAATVHQPGALKMTRHENAGREIAGQKIQC